MSCSSTYVSLADLLIKKDSSLAAPLAAMHDGSHSELLKFSLANAIDTPLFTSCHKKRYRDEEAVRTRTHGFYVSKSNVTPRPAPAPIPRPDQAARDMFDSLLSSDDDDDDDDDDFKETCTSTTTSFISRLFGFDTPPSSPPSSPKSISTPSFGTDFSLVDQMKSTPVSSTTRGLWISSWFSSSSSSSASESDSDSNDLSEMEED